MLILTTTSDVIRCGHLNANAVDYAVSYVDNTTAAYTPGRQVAVVSGAGPTTVLGSPAASTQRQCKHFQACTRGGANTITVEVFDGTTAYRQLSVALLTGETLEYEDAAGWFVKDASGQVKQATAVNLTLTGDVTGSGSGTIATTLANIPNDVPAAGDILVTAIAAPATPAAGKARVYVDSTSKNLAVKNDAGTVNHGIQTKAAVANQWITSVADDGSSVLAQPAFSNLSGTATQAQLPDVVVGVQTFTAGGTYTAAAGVRSQLVEGWAGGGGGGGVTVASASQIVIASGGGSGGYFRRRYAIIGLSTGTVVVGGAGAAGAVTGAAAGNGGNTTFTDGTTLCTANGGTGAPAGLASSASAGAVLGGAGAAVGTNGNLNVPGSNGGFAKRDANTGLTGQGYSGRGADSAFSNGGGGIERIASGAGNAGIGTQGSGGSGALALSSGAAALGGAGAAGMVIITEFA